MSKRQPSKAIRVRQNETEKREKAAQLIAEDRLSDENIADQVGVARSTLARWKTQPAFVARVSAITAAYAKRVLAHGIARRERRVAVLNELHDKMLQVIVERSEDPELASIPGGKTGLVTKMLKGIGKGDDFRVVEVFEVDTGIVKEIRALQEQVAEEVGHRVARTEMVDLNRLFERMTPAELEAYAREGKLPAWFPAGQHQEPSRYVC